MGEVDGYCIFIIYGYFYNIKMIFMNLWYCVCELNVDFVFFGYLYELGVDMLDDIIILNLGSIFLLRGCICVKIYVFIDLILEGI